MSIALQTARHLLFACTFALATMFLAESCFAAGVETVLYSFTDGPDGEHPETGLAIDPSGNLYGTTFGTNKSCSKNCGTLFSFHSQANKPSGLTTLYTFTGKSDGASPIGQPVYRQKVIYGTTESGGGFQCGGFGCGTVFSFSSGVIYPVPFCKSTYPNCPNGAVPLAGPLVVGENIFGTTELGGSADGALCDSQSGCGTVYELTKGATAPVAIYSFCSQSDCADGSKPASKLITDANGDLFGTTQYGGTYGGGAVFELLSGTNAYMSVYSFCQKADCPDGELPVAGVVADSSGNLYGTTFEGGDPACNCGVLFELQNNLNGTYTYQPLHTFLGGTGDGAFPDANLTIDDSTGPIYIYGTTTEGGGGKHCLDAAYCGTVFEWTASGNYHVLYTFGRVLNRHDGARPEGSLRESSDGTLLYGVTRFGGHATCQCGTLFEIALQDKLRGAEKPPQRLSRAGEDSVRPRTAH